MKLYIADPHFYHDEMINDKDNRGFPTVHAMNEYMIARWNEKVQGGDQIIILGDLFWSKEPKEINKILHRLKGKICLIEGNHDCRWLKKEGVELDRFEWIKPYAEFKDGENMVIVSHYPIPCYNHQYQLNDDGTPRTYMLYGHVHDSHDERLVNKFQKLTREMVIPDRDGGVRKIPCNMINCFCKFSDYMPLSLQEWIAVDGKRRELLDLE